MLAISVHRDKTMAEGHQHVLSSDLTASEEERKRVIRMGECRREKIGEVLNDNVGGGLKDLKRLKKWNRKGDESRILKEEFEMQKRKLADLEAGRSRAHVDIPEWLVQSAKEVLITTLELQHYVGQEIGEQSWALADGIDIDNVLKDLLLSSAVSITDAQDRDRSLVTDAKVVPYKTVAPQHRPLICTLKIAPPRLKQVERCGCTKNQVVANEREGSSCDFSCAVTTVNETWKKATDAIRQAALSEHGIAKYGRRMVGPQAGMAVDR
ncbi:unnamed protein product [Heligmosomoides polygyrus]|uniref:NOG1_N domain-containing protein n=1 Tax=Heligmosomoides polygyrus TaxID=6339 RepID=A0A183G216_HELPZ|nr:unnamed protein product [Heligmosomoides polygyrus]